MQWEATDQFGNLYVGTSKSTDPEGLADELASMLEELSLRGVQSPALTIDLSYGEICGPDPDHVSHILQAPWLSGLSASDAKAQIEAVVQRVAADHGIPEPRIEVR